MDHPAALLVPFERRTVGNHQDFGPRLMQGVGNVFVPHILADHQAQLDPAKSDGHRQRAGIEYPHLVEHAVIGQMMFQANRRNGAAIQQQDRIVQHRAHLPRRPHQHRGTAVGSLRRQSIHSRNDPVQERLLQHQILGRIAGKRQFRKDHKIRAARSGPRRKNPLRIAVNVADGGIDLGQGNGKRIGHRSCLRQARYGVNESAFLFKPQAPGAGVRPLGCPRLR